MNLKTVLLITEEDVGEIIDTVLGQFLVDVFEILDEVENIEEEFNGYFYDAFMDLLIEHEVKSAIVLHGKTFYICRNGDEFFKVAKRMGVDWRSMLRQVLRESEVE